MSISFTYVDVWTDSIYCDAIKLNWAWTLKSMPIIPMFLCVLIFWSYRPYLLNRNYIESVLLNHPREGGEENSKILHSFNSRFDNPVEHVSRYLELFLFWIKSIFFFDVGPPKEDIFLDHLLWSIFQLSLHILQITIFHLFSLKNSLPCWDLKLGPPEYQADVLPIELSRLGKLNPSSLNLGSAPFLPWFF